MWSNLWSCTAGSAMAGIGCLRHSRSDAVDDLIWLYKWHVRSQRFQFFQRLLAGRMEGSKLVTDVRLRVRCKDRVCYGRNLRQSNVVNGTLGTVNARLKIELCDQGSAALFPCCETFE